MTFRHLDVEYLAKCEKCQQTDCRREHLKMKLLEAASAGTADQSLMNATKDAINRCRKLEKSIALGVKTVFLATKAR